MNVENIVIPAKRILVTGKITERIYLVRLEDYSVCTIVGGMEIELV